jgi:hypothetical protein
MLPFLKKSQESGVSSEPEKIRREPDEGEGFDSLEVAAEDFLFAIEKKDSKALAQALRAAFMICESEPHEEQNG